MRGKLNVFWAFERVLVGFFLFDEEDFSFFFYIYPIFKMRRLSPEISTLARIVLAKYRSEIYGIHPILSPAGARRWVTVLVSSHPPPPVTTPMPF